MKLDTLLLATGFKIITFHISAGGYKNRKDFLLIILHEIVTKVKKCLQFRIPTCIWIFFYL